MAFLSPKPVRLGLVCLARLTFEADLAAQWYAQAQALLRTLPGVELQAVDKLVVEVGDAHDAIADLQAKKVDALVVLSGTFALGGLAMRLAQEMDVPLLLWAWPEPPEQTGKLRLNSLVGLMVNASNLYKLGYRPTTLYAALDDPNCSTTIARFARLAGLGRDLRQVRLGLIGGHAPGFDNLAVDKLALRRALGVEVVDIALPTVAARAKGVPPARAQAAGRELLAAFDDTSEVTPVQGELYAALTIALRELAEELDLDALALKCWGDLVEAYGIAGCGAVARLGNDGLVFGCEGDVLGTLTMLIAQRLCGIPAVLTDLISVERDSNTGLFWHIGCAPLCLAAPNQPRHLYAHFAGGKGLTAGFALRPGRLTILRLGDDGHGRLRLLATTGRALETEMAIRGTVSQVAFDSDVGAFLDELLTNGWEHHLILAYGDIVPDLAMVGQMLGIPLRVMRET